MNTTLTAPMVTDWMQGWSSIAGAVFGLLATLITGALLWYEVVTGRRAREEAAQDRADAAKDRDRLDAERRDADMAQARTVAISNTILMAGTAAINRVIFSIHNYGPAPVLDVETHVEVRTKLGTLRAQAGCTSVIGPGEAAKVDKITPEFSTVGHLDGMSEQDLIAATFVEVRFTDVRGLRWRRVDSGQPERVTD